MACRPGTDDTKEPSVVAALEQARRDPELQQWWERQQSFQRSVRESFRSAQPPASLRGRILARARIIEVPWWRHPVTWSAAAGLALLISFFALRPESSREMAFETFRSRMIGNVLRQYSMTIRTNEMAPIRQHLATNGAPADYKIPQNLARLPLLGAGVLSWRDRRISMVCFDSGAQGTVFLFVANESSLRGAPHERDFAMVDSLNTMSWTERGQVYVLAANGGREWLRTLF